MGSSVDIFDTSGPAAAGPPPHVHPWEEVYVVLSGELEVTVEGETRTLSAGGRRTRSCKREAPLPQRDRGPLLDDRQ